MLRIYQEEIKHQLKLIMEAIQPFDAGATIEEIKKATGLNIELRTFQRRVEKLITTGKLKQSGTKRSARYSLVQPILHPSNSSQHKANIIVPDIDLSPKSLEILKILSTPFEQRPIIGYDRSFLDKYKPNVDFYLSESERLQLANDTVTNAVKEQPAGTYAKHILQRLLIDLSWNSSRLEGNTYSLLDTERLLKEGAPAADKSATETQMILNHKEAIEFIVNGGDEIGFNKYTLLNLHAMLANNLLPDPSAPGRLRAYPVGIKSSAYTPIGISQLIEEMFEKILLKAAAINDPHEQALFVMVQIPYLQPFEDINKRVSRLAANLPLNKNNLIPISFIGVPDDLYIQGLLAVYELNRTELLKDIFLFACTRSADRYATVRQTISEPDPFRIKYRQELQQIIYEIISGTMDKEGASFYIKSKALTIPTPDQNRFIELIETELLSMHEGNFARYRISPAEFKKWQTVWSK